jgi:hypothetical protein
MRCSRPLSFLLSLAPFTPAIALFLLTLPIAAVTARPRRLCNVRVRQGFAQQALAHLTPAAEPG